MEPDSPLEFSLPGGVQIKGPETQPCDIAVFKNVNSAFLGTNMDACLQTAGIRRLVVAGFLTNFCVENTVRMAGNMGCDVYLAHDACATCDRPDLAGRDYGTEIVHDTAIASIHGKFCTMRKATNPPPPSRNSASRETTRAPGGTAGGAPWPTANSAV